MKQLILAALLALTPIAYAKDSGIGLRLAHMATEYSNMGVCAVDVRYVLDSNSDDIKSLGLVLSIKNTKGQVVHKEDFLIDDMNSTSGKYWGSIFLEGENLCDTNGWTLEVSKANLNFDGGRVENLIKLNRVYIKDFKPMAIKVRK
jgi:hypothetical protein